MKKPADRYAVQALEMKAAIVALASSCRLTLAREEADVYGLTLSYQNEVAGVQFEFSPPDGGGWGGVIARLVDGQFPKHPIHINHSTHLNRFDVRDLAVERISSIPRLADKIGRIEALSATDIVEIVDCCGSDVLQGDFTVFSRLREIVMKRVAQLGA